MPENAEPEKVLTPAAGLEDQPFDLGPDPNEHAVRQQRTEEIRKDAIRLSEHLGYSYRKLESRDQALLHRWVAMFPAQIRWYTARREELIQKQENQLFWLWSLLALAILLVITPGAFQFFLKDPKFPDLWASTLGVLIPTMFGSWRMVLGVRDVRAQIKAFWQARTALTDRMYAFLGESFPAPEGPHLHTGLRKSLDASLRDGRAIAEEERQAFFEAFLGPEEVLKSSGTLLTQVGKNAEVLRSSIKEKQRRRQESLEWVEDSRLELRLAFERVQWTLNTQPEDQVAKTTLQRLQRQRAWLEGIAARLEKGEYEYLPESARVLPGE